LITRALLEVERGTGEFSDFIATRRSPQTKEAYAHWAHLVVGDPDRFIILARTEKQKAEQVVADFIVRTKGRILLPVGEAGLQVHGADVEDCIKSQISDRAAMKSRRGLIL
jgi:hypothetical protein